MSKTRENHCDGVIGGEREIRGGDEGLELVDDSGEDWIRESVQGAPTGVAERRIEGPDVVGG